MNDTRHIAPYASRPRPQGLADVLDRVLDKGVVIAGDISISLVSVELLTIRIRLLIASVDKAREMGIDWWTRDTNLSDGQGKQQQLENDDDGDRKQLLQRIERLEAQLQKTPARKKAGAKKTSAKKK